MHRTLGKSYVQFYSANSAGLSDRAYLSLFRMRPDKVYLNIETARTIRMPNRSFIRIHFLTKIKIF
jgi:hypothetical protein